MLQFLCAGVLVAENLASLRIDAGHHVPDDPVLSRRIHGLENQQERVTVGGVKTLLQPVQFGDLLAEQRLVSPFGIVEWIDAGRPPTEFDGLVLTDNERREIYLHNATPPPAEYWESCITAQSLPVEAMVLYILLLDTSRRNH